LFSRKGSFSRKDLRFSGGGWRRLLKRRLLKHWLLKHILGSSLCAVRLVIA
jgi:hypothetical protein